MKRIRSSTTIKWIGVGLYVAFIFLTAPVLPGIISSLSARLGRGLNYTLNLIRLLTLAGLSIAILYYIFQNGHYKDKKTWLFLFIMATIAGIVLSYYEPIEATHLLEYGLLSVLIIYALAGEKHRPFPINLYYKAALITLLIGIADEIHQGSLPNRVFDVNDILINAISGVLGLFFLWGMNDIQNRKLEP